MPLFHFLLVYDLVKRELVHQAKFADAAEASAEYERLEREHRGDPDLEIVLLGADSIETIQSTHGNYFNGKGPAKASPYLAVVRK